MKIKPHHFESTALWTGNRGQGTSSVSGYARSHTISTPNKPDLHLTTGNTQFGDANKLNPEDLLVAAVSSCHMLSYLYLCAAHGVVVTDYKDHATGTMIEHLAGGGNFTGITLRPHVVVANASMIEKALELHHKAHEICYIANSVNFEVKNEPVCTSQS